MDENFDWTNGIVAICGDKSQPVGTGFVVSDEGLIATCAHVLDQAGWRYQEWDAPVQVRFKANGDFAEAFVLEACYVSQERGDLAILALYVQTPAGVDVLPLSSAAGTVGHNTYTYGYPAGHRDGLRGEARVIGPVYQDGQQRLQLRSEQATLGYSGSPVWDDEWQRVIGMVVAGKVADKRGRHGFTDFAIPGDTLADLYPGRLALSLPDPPGSEADRSALNSFLSMVARQGNRLPLAPLDPAGQDSAHISLAQVFVSLNAGVTQRPGMAANTFFRFSAALGHIYWNRRLILLGDPGSGKTTLLRFVSMCLAQAFLDREAGWQRKLRWTYDLLGPRRQREVTMHDGGLQYPVRPYPPGALTDDYGPDPTDPAWIEAYSERLAAIEVYSERLTDIEATSGILADQESRTRSSLPDLRVLESSVTAYWQDLPLIPVFVELRDFAQKEFDPESPLAIWEHVAGRLEEVEDWPEVVEPLRRRALAGQLVFLLDGVDEVPLERRPLVWRAIDALEAGPFGGNRWVATCRILSFVEDEAPAAVASRTLEALDGSQIAAFIRGWYIALAESGELDREMAKSMATNLTAATEIPRLRSLAQNPMLLTIMALVQAFHGTLPDERAMLYQACVETLLLRWQRHKERTADSALLPAHLVELGIKKADLERLLWQVAWVAHNESAGQDEPADIPESQVMQIAAKVLGSYARAEAFIQYTEQRAHLLIGRGGIGERVYTFPHRTFQEYLAACQLASGRRFPQQAARLAEDPGRWRETLSLAAGTLVFNQNNREKALDGVAGILPRRLPEADDEAGWNRVWLAGEMMSVVGREAAEVDEVGHDLLPVLREYLVALLEGGRLAPSARIEACDSLGRIGDPRPGVCTRLPDMIAIPAGRFTPVREEIGARAIKLPEFAIARYLVTNAQFRLFIDDGGYTDRWRDCWTKAGWQWRELNSVTTPKFWDSSNLPIENKPVVGVSWYEAIAFGAWLSRTSGQDFGLPSLVQWDRVARRADGRELGVDDLWQGALASTEEANSTRLTAVGCFPGAAAKCGAHDLGGNVWEWCQTRYYNEQRSIYPTRYRADDGREALPGGMLRLVGGGQLPRRPSSNPPSVRALHGGFRLVKRLD